MLPKRLYKQTQTKRSGWLVIRLMWKTSSLLCGMLLFRRTGKSARQRGRKTRIEEFFFQKGPPESLRDELSQPRVTS